MTSTTLERSLAQHTRPPAARPATRRSARHWGTTLVLIVSLICAGLMRQLAEHQAKAFNPADAPQSRSTLGNMDSFALALMLGGLRGPLVMFLWMSSETQKQDKNLDDFDTKLEWIRLLQPEFVTVAIFQIWNKAYNISAMMASPANKYGVIMEALDYADKFEKERPGEVNILNSISNVYSGKLGTDSAPEFPFYSRQFREETLTDANRIKAFPMDIKRFTRLNQWQGPLLDENNQIRADLLRPSSLPSQAAPAPQGEERNDGSELQYLPRYGPFPYGISALAMSYNYAKRAEVAVSVEHQKPTQLSPMVIDSRPGLQLKFWAEDEVRRGRAAEARAFNINPALAAEQVYAQIAAFDPANANSLNTAGVEEALYYYRSGARVSQDALGEYARHLAKPDYAMRLMTYESHIADLQSANSMCEADHDFLAALVTTDTAERRRLFLNASSSYAKAATRFERTTLQFFTEEPGFQPSPLLHGRSAFPAQYPAREDVAKIPEGLLDSIFDKAMLVVGNLAPAVQEHRDERSDYMCSVNRCRTRIGRIKEALDAMK